MRTGGKRETEKGGWRGGRGLAHGPAEGHRKKNYDSLVCSSNGSSVERVDIIVWSMSRHF